MVADNEHRAARPSWRCLTDGGEWPCAEARARLAAAFGDRDELSRQMARLQATAADDLTLANPASLHRRFVKWTRDHDESCRACGSHMHAVVPGIPPRLVPCDDLRDHIRTTDHRPESEPDSGRHQHRRQP